MDTISNFYPIFEGDQVLTATHLNSMRAYLEGQQLVTRSHLIGIGIVCGMEISNPDNSTIRISEGIGITSRGYLVSIPTCNCTRIRMYADKEVEDIENSEGMERPGKYPLFLAGDPPQQIFLWELMTEEEEKAVDDAEKFVIDLSAGTEINGPEGSTTVNFDNMYVLLYLEIFDDDLEDCFNDDCDEVGIQRNFKVRKLLVSKADLVGIINRGRSGETDISESELEAEVNGCFTLPELCIPRLGYGQGKENLSLTEYTNFSKLYREYESIIESSAPGIGHALFRLYETFLPLIDDLSNGNNPFDDLAETNGSNPRLRQIIERAFSGQKYSIQYRYDFLKDLVDAYEEFRKVACEAASLCRPFTNRFPRHLMAGKAVIEVRDTRTPFRHYFQPSPVHTHQSSYRRKARVLFQRLVKMRDSLGMRDLQEMPLKITPSKNDIEPLSRRSIPYYFDIDNDNRLEKYWNFENSVRFKSRYNLSYHAPRYNKVDDCVIRPNHYNYDRYPFLRIEGHVGKKYEDVLAEIERLRNELNLPVKIVGLKLSHRFDNTRVGAECKFEDLQNLYKTFTTEMKCLLEEQMLFFRNLKVKPKTGKTEAAPDDKEKIIPEKSTGIEKESISTLAKEGTATKESTAEKIGFGYFETQKEAVKYEHYLGKSGTQFEFVKGFAPSYTEAAYKAPKEGTLGYYYDAFATSGKTNYLDTIVSFDPTVLQLPPKVLVFLLLKPAQVANKIQALMNTIPDKLENFNLNELSESFDSLVQIATEYKEDIEEQDDDLNGQDAMILYRLDKLIYSCSIKKLQELHTIYEERSVEFKKLNLFANFAKTHSGMEHMAGVPKGGTFVLVYIDENEVSPKPIFEIPQFFDLSDILKVYETGEYKKTPLFYTSRQKDELFKNIETVIREIGKTSIEKELGIKGETLVELDKSIKDKVGEVSKAAKIPERLPQNVVVADFALPYLYKCECPELSVMVISQISFSLPKTQFCKKDTDKYEFVMDPVGGEVESSAGGVSSEGNKYFFTPGDADPGDEEIRFTYRVNNQTVVFNARVYDPKADFDFTTNVLEDGNVEVTFVNNSTGALTYEWKFGDGQSSTEVEPVHIYKKFGEEKAIVTLKASKYDCSDEITKSVTIPQEIPVEFDLQPSKTFEDLVYCNTDTNAYEFLTVPAGDEIEGDDTRGVFEQSGIYFFVPEGYNTGSYAFKYKQEELSVKILEGPVPEFTYDAEPTPDLNVYIVTFKTEDTAESILWTIDRKVSLKGAEVTQQMVSGKHHVLLRIVSEEGCPGSTEKEFILERRIPVEDPVMKFDPGSVDAMKNDTLDARLFDGDNPIHLRTREVVTKIGEELGDPVEKERVLTGEKNDELAKAFGEAFTTATDMIREISGTASSEETEYLAGYFGTQVKTVLDVVSMQETDLKEDEQMMTLLGEVEAQVAEMKQAGIEVDRDGTLATALDKYKLQAEKEGKNNLVKAVDEINSALKG